MSGFQVSSAKAERHGLDHGAQTEVASNEEPMRASQWDGGIARTSLHSASDEWLLRNGERHWGRITVLSSEVSQGQCQALQQQREKSEGQRTDLGVPMAQMGRVQGRW